MPGAGDKLRGAFVGGSSLCLLSLTLGDAFGLWYDEDYSLKSIALNVVTAVFLWPITVLMLIFGFKEMMGKRQLRRRREELEAERIPQRETQ